MLWRFKCSACYTTLTRIINADEPEAPWKDTKSDGAKLRESQQIPSLPHSAKNELRGLIGLTQWQCQLTPNLVDHYQTQQLDGIWIPGGYILFIAMSYCPGGPVGDKFRRMRVKREKGFEKRFRRAYEYVSFFFLCYYTGWWLGADGLRCAYGARCLM